LLVDERSKRKAAKRLSRLEAFALPRANGTLFARTTLVGLFVSPSIRARLHQRGMFCVISLLTLKHTLPRDKTTKQQNQKTGL
jgi:hypothetical protein